MSSNRSSTVSLVALGRHFLKASLQSLHAGARQGSEHGVSVEEFVASTTCGNGAWDDRDQTYGPLLTGQVRKTDMLNFIGVISQLYCYYNGVAQGSNYVEAFVSIPEAKVCDLVHFDCKFSDDPSSRGHIIDINSEHLLQLVRHNAATLQSLFTNVSKVKDVSDLILEPSGRYAKYPCLHTLKLHGKLTISNASARGGQQPPLANTDMEDDETLFRGNATTLEYLDLKVYPATVDIICKHAVFTSGSHPKLQLVNTVVVDELRALHFTNAEEQMRFVLGIAPHASVRKINGQLSKQVLPLLFDHACIRVLSLPGTSVDFWDVISLIKSLPLLMDLRTSPPSFGPKPAGIKLNRLPSYMVDTYAPLSVRFGRWYFKSQDGAEMALCVLLLATVCPKFAILNPVLYRGEYFMAAM
ncbi:hypothetical protein GGI17_001410 [Coemansia sp. S146]|nr:hypothetical protein GGI17_001410 [Coemansia sp. S146]